ncbi:hypothetical protein ACRAKI_35095 [Saccharothrix isguenensis]
MTTMVPTPEIVALHAFRRAAARVLDLLIAMLTPATPKARHRAPSPLKVRLQQWKSAVVGLPVRTPHPERTRYPTCPARPTTPAFGVPRTDTWNSFHPPPRTAQCADFTEPIHEPSADHLGQATRTAAHAADDTDIDWPTEEFYARPITRLIRTLAEGHDLAAGRPAYGDAEDWEFTPGELSRWWEEAATRLDAPGGLSGQRPW